jgi:hypothetical protein
MSARKWALVALALLAALVGTVIARSLQGPSIRTMDEATLRTYAGTYQWQPSAFVYLQIWSELSGSKQLVAFDESGEVRTLYSTDPDRFVAGPGAAVQDSVESCIQFQRDGGGQLASLTWSRGGVVRTARRVDIERREDVRFSNGDVQLAGTLTSPTTQGPHPAVILVHASGAEDREYLLAFARFLMLIVYDPSPVLRRIKIPLLALLGELDNNILAEKNRAAWEASLKAGGHTDYTLRILPKANHAMLEAKVGTNAETKSLQRFVPGYSEVVLEWLGKRITGLSAAR